MLIQQLLLQQDDVFPPTPVYHGVRTEHNSALVLSLSQVSPLPAPSPEATVDGSTMTS